MPTRRRFLLLATAGAAALAGAFGWNRMANARYHDGPVSDHWDGQHFFNPGKPRDQGFLDLLRWQTGGGWTPWPETSPALTARPAPRVEGARLVVTAIGHASFLVQTRGLNVLLDPVYVERASPFQFAGPRRVNAPGVPFDLLPRIDVVLVSHNHYDHMDLETLARLWARDGPVILAPLGNDAIVRAAHPDITVRTLDWRQAIEVAAGVRVHLAEMHHWSARGLGDRNKALWGAFVIETPDGGIYHVGDSGYGGGDYFRIARERFGGFRLAILPIGAYEPRWFMSYSHMNPDEAVRAMIDCGAAFAIAHHWGTFRLTNEGIDDPPRALAAALATHGVPPEAFPAPRPGGVVEVPLPTTGVG